MPSTALRSSTKQVGRTRSNRPTLDSTRKCSSSCATRASAARSARDEMCWAGDQRAGRRQAVLGVSGLPQVLVYDAGVTIRAVPRFPVLLNPATEWIPPSSLISMHGERAFRLREWASAPRTGTRLPSARLPSTRRIKPELPKNERPTAQRTGPESPSAMQPSAQRSG